MRKLSKIFAVASICLAMTQAADAANLENLPSYDEWQEHASHILKFYLVDDAKGKEDGYFPTWRCDNGKLRNKKACEGEGDTRWVSKIWHLDFTRMLSRQTFAYGALFNLTGNKEALRLHKAGVKFLLERAMRKDGGFYSLFEEGKPVTDSEIFAENPQDLSYALVGLAMNAYLTGDKKTISAIIKAKDYIFDNYYDKDKGFLIWSKKDTYFDKMSQEELVAQLDQLNAYMLLTWRMLPDNSRKEWGEKMKEVVDIINTKFYNEKLKRFNGCTDNPSCFDLEKGKHLDYGHRVKSYWMEYMTALGLDDKDLIEFSKNGMIDVHKKAVSANGYEFFGDELLNGASWWVCAELNQTALTLALTGDNDIPNTLFNVLNNETDKEYGEVKFGGYKAHFWRNGFHSSEQALIGTILSNALRQKECSDDKCFKDNSTTLYFAPANEETMTYTPYLYSGDIIKKTNTDGIVAVTFDNINLPKKVD